MLRWILKRKTAKIMRQLSLNYSTNHRKITVETKNIQKTFNFQNVFEPKMLGIYYLQGTLTATTTTDVHTSRR